MMIPSLGRSAELGSLGRSTELGSLGRSAELGLSGEGTSLTREKCQDSFRTPLHGPAAQWH